jgi:hypothetical protein
LNGEQLQQGDGASIENERHITLSGSGAEILLFDLA